MEFPDAGLLGELVIGDIQFLESLDVIGNEADRDGRTSSSVSGPPRLKSRTPLETDVSPARDCVMTCPVLISFL